MVWTRTRRCTADSSPRVLRAGLPRELRVPSGPDPPTTGHGNQVAARVDPRPPGGAVPCSAAYPPASAQGFRTCAIASERVPHTAMTPSRFVISRICRMPGAGLASARRRPCSVRRLWAATNTPSVVESAKETPARSSTMDLPASSIASSRSRRLGAVERSSSPVRPSTTTSSNSSLSDTMPSGASTAPPWAERCDRGRAAPRPRRLRGRIRGAPGESQPVSGARWSPRSNEERTCLEPTHVGGAVVVPVRAGRRVLERDTLTGHQFEMGRNVDDVAPRVHPAGHVRAHEDAPAVRRVPRQDRPLRLAASRPARTSHALEVTRHTDVSGEVTGSSRANAASVECRAIARCGYAEREIPPGADIGTGAATADIAEEASGNEGTDGIGRPGRGTPLGSVAGRGEVGIGLPGTGGDAPDVPTSFANDPPPPRAARPDAGPPVVGGRPAPTTVNAR